MKFRSLLVIFALSTAYFATGCTSVRSGGNMGCGPLGCGSIASAPQTVSSCGGDCTSCAGDCTQGCGSSCTKSCGKPFDVCLPKINICNLGAQLRSRLTCTSGCSDEVYWGEWYYDPPKCEPCDRNGNWTGSNPNQVCRPGFKGIRFGRPACGGCGGCSSCGSDTYETIIESSSGVPTEASAYYSEPPAWNGSESTTDVSTTRSTMVEHQSVPTSIHTPGRKPHQLGRGTY
ncbi:MAG: hypothetical protein ACKVH8_13790 [Pirellulales bacterium]|jgi:hypothetical protein